MLEPQQFGKYTLTRRLAFGGMAEIFLAELRGTQGFVKHVVLKRILPQFGSDPHFVSMFTDEAVIAARLTHANIVQVYDFGEVDNVYFIAMEYVEGADLRRVIQIAQDGDRAIAPAEVAAIGEGICAGLSYAHSALGANGEPLNIVHRDVSPHNIMLSRGGETKIMDFGIAKAEARATRTATGAIKGKVAYMAPEQVRGLSLDKRCDQFAVGLVLWESLTGRRTFEGDSDLELLRKVTECSIVPPSMIRADVPKALDVIIMRALSESRDDRYPDLAEMRSELSAFRFSLGQAGDVQLDGLVSGILLDESPIEPPRRTMSLGGHDAPISATVQARPRTSTDWKTPVDGALDTRSGEGPAPSADDALGESRVPPQEERAPSTRLWAGVGLVMALLASVAFVLTRGTARTRVEEIAVATPTTRVEIVSKPAGASILISGAETGLTTPAILPKQARGQTLPLGLRLAGHVIWEKAILLSSPEQRVEATLIVFPAAPALPPVGGKAPVVRGRSKALKPKRRAETGYISLRSAGPWVHVFHRGEKLGTTPLKRVEVPAGRIQLRLVNRDEDIDDSVVLSVGAGEEVRSTLTPSSK